MRFTWLELSRARVWRLALALVVLGCIAAEFGASLAVTESGAHRIAFYAAGMRLVAVFVMALLVAASVLREFDDKAVEAILSRPVSRGDWYLGRFGGYAGIAFVFAFVVAIPLLVQVPAAASLWAYALALELIIVTAATLAMIITVRQLPVALCAVAGFYLLSRGIAGFALMSTGPTVDPGAVSTHVIAWIIDALAHVLPAFDRYTSTVWLIDALPPVTEIIFISLQSVVYVVLLVAVGLFDLHRRNF